MSGIELGIGTNIVAWFQGWGVPIVSYILYPFHYIGGEYGYLVLLPIVYWAISKEDGKRLMILALGSALIGQYLKFIFRRPRPFQVSPDRVTAVFEETGFGVPSGHTLLGTVVAGYAWYRFPRAWVRVVAVAFALLMGISRMVHGVHFPQDVLAGAVLGLALIAVFWWLDTSYSQAMAAWPLGRKLLLTLIISAVAFVLALVVEHDYEERKAMLSIVGAILGGLSGFALETRFVRFSTGGKIWIRIVRTLVGLVITLGIFVGLDALYDVVTGGSTGLGALILYVIRYGLVSFFVALGAPALYVRLKLANTEG
mgnify:CR=1 FL=1